MRNVVKSATAGAALGGALFFTAGLGMAQAAPQDGQVALALGNAGVVEDVDPAAAAKIAVELCDDADVAQVTQAAQTVDVDGTQQNVCTGNLGPITIQDNGQSQDRPGEAAPGQPQGAQGQGQPEGQGTSEGAPAQPGQGTGQSGGAGSADGQQTN